MGTSMTQCQFMGKHETWGCHVFIFSWKLDTSRTGYEMIILQGASTTIEGLDHLVLKRFSHRHSSTTSTVVSLKYRNYINAIIVDISNNHSDQWEWCQYEWSNVDILKSTLYQLPALVPTTVKICKYIAYHSFFSQALKRWKREPFLRKQCNSLPTWPVVMCNHWNYLRSRQLKSEAVKVMWRSYLVNENFRCVQKNISHPYQNIKKVK